MSEPDAAGRPPEFDRYATNYDQALAKGLSVSGESKDYFAEGRAAWLARHQAQFRISAGRVLDFGCGTGGGIPALVRHLKPGEAVGVDVSADSLETARRHWASLPVRFHTLDDLHPSEDFDLAFCNGVFHHIAPSERVQAVDYVFRALKPGGHFAFCENNPLNPGTRYVMSRIPFDRDAITLTPFESCRLLRAGGFSILTLRSLFFFPRSLSFLRALEPALERVPMGAQYLVLCQRPGAA